MPGGVLFLWKNSITGKKEHDQTLWQSWGTPAYYHFGIERGNCRLGRMKLLPGSKILFGRMGSIRELRSHSNETAKLPEK
jgi:hypothetical protein